MEKLKHILITGEIGVGKTMLVKKIIRLVERDIQGFYTRKIQLMNHEGESGIYIYNILSKEEEEEITCLAICNERGPKKIHRERFDRYSEKYMEYNKEKIIIMDEIGFLENESFSFQNKILQLLDGEIPIIAVVKNKNSAFLNSIKNHEKTCLFTINLDNREAIYGEIKDYLGHYRL